FRMDAKYDHWLLDEFQDTSERQWEVMAPLLEEARQDPEERRSVFLVGDLKQSIYLWRQAEPELFHHVEEAWQGQRLTIRPLNESYRSCPQVLAMVNGVFDASGPELEELFPGVGGLWQYEKHRCSDKVAGLEGHAAMLKAPEVPEESEDDAVTLAAAALIRDIDPLARGLTCAVLVRSNRTAREISDSLRRLLGMEVICESRESVAVDNPATLALLSLLQLAVHPGDTAAWQHVNMTPLRVSIEAEKLGPALVGARLRSDLAAHGFLAVLQAWSEKLVTAMGEVDSFTERRLAQLLDLAADFDETGSRDVDAFLRSAREHTLREDSATAHAIQVMTVHQSKGLQFDVVILPELQGEPLDTVTRNRLFVSRGKRGVVKWLLDKPEKVIVQREDVLRTEQAREKARQAFEGLCRFYVAMTRAKLGLYAVLDPDPHFKGSNEEKLLAKRLGTQNKPTGFAFGEEDGLCVWECGERHWYESHPRRAEEPATEGEDETETVGAGADETPSDFGSLLRQVNRPLDRRAPSGEESFVLKGTELLSTVRESKREFGTRVHELLSAFDWLDDAPDLWSVWLAKGMLLAQPLPATNSEEEAEAELV
ncbi:MAG TPA: 3'-5' exonuclease, partial [Verrucomicrobium sp.]|nr:3'-5' exonuclease [Verrucomicrobium sp.]